MRPLVVVKVGGSLFDLPDLRERLQRVIHQFPDQRVVLLPGGGAGADVIRQHDLLHRIGEEASHWLALRVLSVNADLLSHLVQAPVVGSVEGDLPLAVLDPHSFCQEDENRPGCLEHSWRVTSDSIAGRVVIVGGGKLVLLKSVDMPASMSWLEASKEGLVDEAFATLAQREILEVCWINLRRMDEPYVRSDRAAGRPVPGR